VIWALLHLQWPTNRKLYMIYRMAPFLMTLNDPYLSFKVTSFFDAEYLRNGTRYRRSFNEILIGIYTHTLLSHVISNDLGWVSKIFSDTKRRAVSVRQLSWASCLPTGDETILIFQYQRDGNIPMGTHPLTMASNAQRVWKHHGFQPIGLSRSNSEMMQDRAAVTMEGRDVKRGRGRGRSRGRGQI